jgi:predicted ribonuclease YlaK
MTRSKRIHVLDTNVLMHDPTALFKFEEHDVYLPMQVMEELDNAKKGTTEASRNARQVSRFLNELVAGPAVANVARRHPAFSGRAACSCAASRQRGPAALPDQSTSTRASASAR